MSKKRPSLASLADRLASKPGEVRAVSTWKSAPVPTSESGDQAGDRRGVLVRLSAETRKALKLLAVERDTTVQALVTEAIDDLLGKARKR